MTENDTLDLPPLEELIKARLKKKVNALGSITKVAKDIDLPYPTVYRAQSGAKGASHENAQAFLEYISNDTDELEMFMLHYFPKEAKFWAEVFLKRKVKGELSGVSALIEECYRYYYIYALAGVANGFPLSRVQKHWGEEGLRKASVLIAAEAIEMKDDILTRVEKDIFYSKPDTMLKVIEHNVRYFDLEALKSGLGGIFHTLSGLNEEGVREYRQIMVDTSVRVLKLKADKRFQGDLPAHFSIVTGIAPF